MKYYAVQVKTNQEYKYIDKVTNKLSGRLDKQHFIFPRRRLEIRKAGKKTMQLLPLFPGYIFLETEAIDNDLFMIMRRTPGFYRFLKSNQDITELRDKDLTTLRHFMQFGEIAEPSKVHFDENDRIVVDSGPLQGLEGKIIKVDRRKGRAKIQLDLYTENFLLDLGFEIISKGNSIKQEL